MRIILRLISIVLAIMTVLTRGTRASLRYSGRAASFASSGSFWLYDNSRLGYHPDSRAAGIDPTLALQANRVVSFRTGFRL